MVQYKCDICDYTTTNKKILNEHKKSFVHTLIRDDIINALYKCKYCKCECEDMTELNIHKEKCDSRSFMIKSTRNLKELHDYHNMMIFYANNDITELQLKIKGFESQKELFDTSYKICIACLDDDDTDRFDFII